ncbi:MAG: hypothetical protein IKX89_04880 [Firmicutes bacterium]|nr:hypothetical protein [Bacillota bacterium]
MAVINVYEQYFEAEHTAGGIQRRAALVMLISTSEEGNIRYEAAATFFPHRDEEDYAVSYDDYFSTVLYEARGRRSKKREKALLENFRGTVDGMIKEAGASVFWDRPLMEARMG